MQLKRYSKKEPLIFMWVMIPYIIFLNLLVFGSCILNSVDIFIKSFFYSGIYLCLIYFAFGFVALLIQKRFPSAGDMFKRIAIMLPVFYVMNGIAISGFYSLYEHFPFTSCTAKQHMLFGAVVYGCIMSTIITFINEGVANWEAWKASITETEKLKNAYQRSKVLGLRGQLNPHFLFNCFNTLSGLIQEDEDKAEQFLNEMTKVHRYLLKSDDELLVTLETEIKFAESYLHLAAERFGSAIQSSIDIDQEKLQMFIPPLSLQVILENIIYTNALSKSNPLNIYITANRNNKLAVVNSLHEKTVVQDYGVDDGLDNLLNKYKMLNSGEISIKETGNVRTILLPLFDKNLPAHETY